eukprot:Nk52_evm66s226 gene=Nk52_evmTU66s226
MSQPPEEQLLQRLGRLFGGTKPTASNANSPHNSTNPNSPAAALSPATAPRINKVVQAILPVPGVSLAQRLRTIREVSKLLKTHCLTETEVEALCSSVKDLISNPDSPVEARDTFFSFLSVLIDSQYDRLGMLRTHLFNLIENHHSATEVDLGHKLEVLKRLTKNGRDITYFQERFGPFILSMISGISGKQHTKDFMGLLTNIIKYNFTFLEEGTIMGLIRYSCMICNSSSAAEDVQSCLVVLDVFVRYGYLPIPCLPAFLGSLCRTVNTEVFCQFCWKIMKNLLKSHIGHNAIRSMCDMLEDRNKQDQISLLRGAVFFVGMASWGSQRIQTLKHSYLSVLPTLLTALSYDQPIVAYEIVLSISRLIKKYGNDLSCVEWDIVCSIIEELERYFSLPPQDASGSGGEGDETRRDSSLVQRVEYILQIVEELYKEKKISASEDRIFEVLERFKPYRQEESILIILKYRSENLHPSQEGWLSNIKSLMEEYFRNDRRTRVRLWVLSSLGQILSDCRHLYEEVLLNEVVIPYLKDISEEQDIDVKKRAIELLIGVSVSCCLDEPFDHLLNALWKCCQGIEGFVNRPNSPSSPNGLEQTSSVRNNYIYITLHGLVTIFKAKLHHLPSSHCLKVFQFLLQHTRTHYTNGYNSRLAVVVRHEIMECLMQLRSTYCYRVLLMDGQLETPSPFVFCLTEDELVDKSQNAKHAAISASAGIVDSKVVSVLPIKELFELVLLCFRYEEDGKVFELFMENLLGMLRNKYIFSGKGVDVNRLCHLICESLKSDTFAEQVKFGGKHTKSDIYGYGYQVLTVLISYANKMSRVHQDDLVAVFAKGLVSNWNTMAKPCVYALTICSLELQGPIMKFLPSILTRLSQISSSTVMSLPILEFLSGLIRVSHLYSNFVENDYKLIFSIALQYTDSQKYSLYVVTLAFHVIAVWFIRCRMSDRKKFVPFVIRGLLSNCHKGKDGKPIVDERSETCLDMLSRYTFANCSTHPVPLAGSSLLKSNATTSHWVVGQGVVTIKTYAYGWSEVTVRKATGTVSWLLRLQNNQYSDLEDSEMLSVNMLMDVVSSRPKLPLSQMHGTSHTVAKELNMQVETINVAVGADGMEPASQSNAHTSSSGEGKRVEANGELSEWKSKGKPVLETPLQQKYTAPANVDIPKTTPKLTPVPLVESSQNSFKKDNDCMSMKEFPPSLSNSTDNILIHTRDGEGSEDNYSHSHDETEQGHEDEEESDVACELKEESYSAGRAHAFNAASFSSAGSPNNLSRYDLIPCAQLMSSPDENFVEENSQTGGDDLETQQKYFPPLPSYEESPDETKLEMSPMYFPAGAPPSSGPGIQTSTSNKSDQKPSKVLVDASVMATEPQFTKNLLGEKASSASENQGTGKEQGSSSAVPLVTAAETEKDKVGENVKPTSQVPTANLNKVGQEIQPKTFTDVGGRSQPMTNLSQNNGESMPTKEAKEILANVVLPGFVLMNMSEYPCTGDVPVLLQSGESLERALNVFDRTPPCDTHKIGVVYVADRQTTEDAILRNRHGSVRYVKFIRSLGKLIRLKDCQVYTGGLDRSSDMDGEFAYFWKDDITHVIFHIATLMPTRESDPSCQNKKLHIGNDYVSIVYNDSKGAYVAGTLKGQFNFVEIVIEPLDDGTNEVTVRVKEGMEDLLPTISSSLISDSSLGPLVRQIALHANLASLIKKCEQNNMEFVFNWVERLRQIKRVKERMGVNPPKEDRDGGGMGNGNGMGSALGGPESGMGPNGQGNNLRSGKMVNNSERDRGNPNLTNAHPAPSASRVGNDNSVVYDFTGFS